MKAFLLKTVLILLFAAGGALANYLLNPQIAATAEAAGRLAEAERYVVEMGDIDGLGPLLWVDARSSAAFEDGHAEQAVNLGPEVFDDQLAVFFERWQPQYAVVVYCDGAGCRSSYETAVRLRHALGEAGGRVYVLKGGWPEYLKRKGEVTQ